MCMCVWPRGLAPWMCEEYMCRGFSRLTKPSFGGFERAPARAGQGNNISCRFCSGGGGGNYGSHIYIYIITRIYIYIYILVAMYVLFYTYITTIYR